MERVSLHKGDTRRPRHEYVEVSGQTCDLSSTVSTGGQAKQRARGRHPAWGFEVHSLEEGEVSGGLGTPRKCCSSSPPCSHLCIPSSEQFQNLGELARPPQHEAGQSPVVRRFSFARTQDRKPRVRHMGPLRNANAGLKATGSHGRLSGRVTRSDG